MNRHAKVQTLENKLDAFIFTETWLTSSVPALAVVPAGISTHCEERKVVAMVFGCTV